MDVLGMHESLGMVAIMSILAVTGLPTQGVGRVGRMVKQRFFFGLLGDWAIASWPSLSFFAGVTHQW